MTSTLTNINDQSYGSSEMLLIGHPLQNPADQDGWIDGEADSETCQLILSLGEQLGRGLGACIASDDLLTLSERMIDLIESPFIPIGDRQRAAESVAKLATRNWDVLGLIIRKAEAYALAQHVDDAFPYSPNPFEILADIEPTCERITLFLRKVVSKDYGVAGWSASRALQTIYERLGVIFP